MQAVFPICEHNQKMQLCSPIMGVSDPSVYNHRSCDIAPDPNQARLLLWSTLRWSGESGIALFKYYTEKYSCLLFAHDQVLSIKQAIMLPGTPVGVVHLLSLSLRWDSAF